MSELSEILAYNQNFVESGEYEKYFTDKYPGRELAILSCMDARIIELLPDALGLKNGDAKLIKTPARSLPILGVPSCAAFWSPCSNSKSKKSWSLPTTIAA